MLPYVAVTVLVLQSTLAPVPLDTLVNTVLKQELAMACYPITQTFASVTVIVLQAESALARLVTLVISVAIVTTALGP